MRLSTHVLLAVTLVAGTLGCGTFLQVRQVDLESESGFSGIAVNRRAAFEVKIERDSAVGDALRSKRTILRGVDPRSVVTVDVRRMPFASGKLVVKLTGAQLLKEVTIASETGAVRAVQAADTALDAQRKLDAQP